MNPINERVREVRKTLHLSQKEFARKIGLKQTSICDIEHGRCNVIERNLIAICNQLNVSRNWLESGEGSMFNEIDKRYDEFFSNYKKLNPNLQDFLLKVAKDLLELQEKI